MKGFASKVIFVGIWVCNYVFRGSKDGGEGASVARQSFLTTNCSGLSPWEFAQWSFKYSIIQQQLTMTYYAKKYPLCDLSIYITNGLTGNRDVLLRSQTAAPGTHHSWLIMIIDISRLKSVALCGIDSWNFAHFELINLLTFLNRMLIKQQCIGGCGA